MCVCCCNVHSSPTQEYIIPIIRSTVLRNWALFFYTVTTAITRWLSSSPVELNCTMLCKCVIVLIKLHDLDLYNKTTHLHNSVHWFDFTGESHIVISVHRCMYIKDSPPGQAFANQHFQSEIENFIIIKCLIQCKQDLALVTVHAIVNTLNYLPTYIWIFVYWACMKKL